MDVCLIAARPPPLHAGERTATPPPPPATDWTRQGAGNLKIFAKKGGRKNFPRFLQGPPKRFQGRQVEESGGSERERRGGKWRRRARAGRRWPAREERVKLRRELIVVVAFYFF